YWPGTKPPFSSGNADTLMVKAGPGICATSVGFLAGDGRAHEAKDKRRQDNVRHIPSADIRIVLVAVRPLVCLSLSIPLPQVTMTFPRAFSYAHTKACPLPRSQCLARP